jgi:Reverse transcriptase (RNA-dependent DNA polymerase)
VISPFLANVYLHYVLDLWVTHWRNQRAQGDVIVVRYADDFVLGFQHRLEAERCLQELKERLGKFGLELHPEKTRLIEFGRFAAERRLEAGLGKPETFSFLGFTHYCGKTRKGAFTIKRQSMAKRMRAKLWEIKAQLKRHMHSTVAEMGAWLRSVVRGPRHPHVLARCYHREPALYREFCNQYSLRIGEGARQHEDCVSTPLACGSECSLNIRGTSYVYILKLHPERPPRRVLLPLRLVRCQERLTARQRQCVRSWERSPSEAQVVFRLALGKRWPIQ